jgi:hypothetical protein
MRALGFAPAANVSIGSRRETDLKMDLGSYLLVQASFATKLAMRRGPEGKRELLPILARVRDWNGKRNCATFREPLVIAREAAIGQTPGTVRHSLVTAFSPPVGINAHMTWMPANNASAAGTEMRRSESTRSTPAYSSARRRLHGHQNTLFAQRFHLGARHRIAGISRGPETGESRASETGESC